MFMRKFSFKTKKKKNWLPHMCIYTHTHTHTHIKKHAREGAEFFGEWDCRNCECGK